MTGIIRKVVRTAVVGGVLLAVAAGGVFAVAGQERGKAMLHAFQSEVNRVIDQNIEDPIALRSQLRELQAEYPERIGELRGDLAEVTEQIRQLERERIVSRRVVALATADLEELEAQLAAAGGDRGPTLASLAVSAPAQSVRDRAARRVLEIQKTQAVYSARAAEAEHQVKYLRQQAERMGEMLVNFETEYAQFQTQVAQLELQIDAVARNDRLIELMEERQRTIDELSRFEIASLDQFVSRLSELRSRQEAELELLASDQRRVDYESLARMELEDEQPQALPEVSAEGLSLAPIR